MSIELEKKWGQLLELNPTSDDLHSVLREVKLFKEEALQKLSRQSLSNDDLRIIVENVEPLRVKAEKILNDRLGKLLQE